MPVTSEFSRKEWKDCCGKGCKKCAIAKAYIGAHGRSARLKQLTEDRKTVLAKKNGKKKSGKAKSKKKTSKGKAKS
jgi:hypothetical protein